MKVTDSQGNVYDDGKQPVSYLHGDYDNLFPKLEAALEGQEAGFDTVVQLASADAFGERDEALVTTMPKTDFPPGIKVGGQIRRMGPDGEPRYYFVTKIKGPTVLLDGNHPAVRQVAALCHQGTGRARCHRRRNRPPARSRRTRSPALSCRSTTQPSPPVAEGLVFTTAPRNVPWAVIRPYGPWL
jgi:hypothetical protein